MTTINYLVKTAFGLLGWMKIPGDSQDTTVIDRLFFAGDLKDLLDVC